jgi:hypothetical protein
MNTRHTALSISIVVVAAALGNLGSAHALTMQECSTKYKAAQAAGNKLKWNDFRKAECGADASATPAAAPATAAKPEPAPAAKSGAATDTKAATKAPAAAPATAAPAAVGNAVFPTAVSPKYSGESAGKARMHTCLDQYNANKDKNTNGGLTWIQKGGGYYSECNKRLKG